MPIHTALTRRQFVKGSVAVSLLSGLKTESHAQAKAGDPSYHLYWGDLHNHCAVGYGTGSLERAIDLARAHLDFFAFTGHACWHDMPKMEGDRHMKWVNGFKANAEHWPKTRQLIREANSDKFVALVGYEWHSSFFGDYCVLFPDEPSAELFLPDHINKLLDFAEAKKIVAIPHHPAYNRGWRGTNFDYFRPGPSPVVEIYSEHGCAMSVHAPYPYLRHSNNGRSTANTIEPQLRKGLRFGFVASTDNHRGYPGAYGEGVAGVWATELSAAALFEAICARRTYAATGDRIMLDVSLNGRPMGAELSAVRDRQIDVRVEGQDLIQAIELVRNGQVIDRYFPEDQPAARERLPLPGRAKCRIQYGWGPWADLSLGRICNWEMTVHLNGGRFHKVIPCWQSGPYAEDLRDKLQQVSASEIRLQSFTSREKCYAEDPTKTLVLDLEGGPDAELVIQLTKPVEQTVRAKLADLIDNNIVTGSGGFTGEGHIVGPLLNPAGYTATARFQDQRNPAEGPDYYYVRVVQHNGHLAWSSPIWIDPPEAKKA